jgi:NAD(P)-dependent dehydrogenase (short-subunit alcohol dehydrogenase family)
MFERRVAVVTGGSRGIGRGIVGELAGLGLGVVVNYRSDRDSAEAACREAEGRGAPKAVAIRADVGDIEEGRGLVGRVMEEFGRVDVWVNNAGIAPEARRDLLETSPESFDRVLGTNLRGPYFLTQRAASAMVGLARSGRLEDPQIHFITSVSSRFASVNRGEYCVAKAGLSMVAQLFAARLAAEGIRVFEIRPGIIDTEMIGAVRSQYERRAGEGLVPLGRLGAPVDVGRAVAGLAAGGLPYATGGVIEVDGGLHIRRL